MAERLGTDIPDGRCTAARIEARAFGRDPLIVGGGDVPDLRWS